VTAPQQPPRGRFAPSPTGLLHLGHAQTMLLAWLQMRALGGALVLRVEDVDGGRCQPDADAALHQDLRWLGFDWDEGPDVGGPCGPYRQSERGERYRDALERLGYRLFACSCTRKELRAASPGGGELRYPGTCRSGPTHPERPTSLRVRVDPGIVAWQDAVLGPQQEDPSAVCGDFILRAKNGDFTYQLACTVDDVAMDITHVLRGEDLLSSTGRQLLLHRWLGGTPPAFAHVPLLRDDEGLRLAKRRGSPPIAALREAGEDPRVVLGRVAGRLGLVPAGEAARPGDLLAPFRSRFPNLLAVA
jgi:glutamyl-tRNA synthetase